MLVILLSIIYVLICFLLVGVVLLQQGKGGGVSSAFGIGGASQTLFGASGAGNFLTRATSILGGAFMLLSFLLALMSGAGKGPTQQRSVLQPSGTQSSVPASPVPGTRGLPGGPAAPVPGAPGPEGTPSVIPQPPAGETGTGAGTGATPQGTSGGTGN